MITTITFTLFERYPQLRHAISIKKFGPMKKENNEVHHANVLKFIKSVSTKSMGICMGQIHSGNVQIVENNRLLVIEETDAVITDRKNLALTVLTADCLPILMFDPVKNAVAAVHAGSKGLLFHVIEHTIHALGSAYDTNPKDLLVGIGPSICKSCYEVRKSFAKQYEKAFPDFTDIISVHQQKHTMDLRNIAVQILTKEGILNSNIEVSNYCTRCDNTLFYSYRRGDKTERIAGFIALE